MSVSRPLVVFAGLNGALAVALGAFAAHGASPGVKTLLTTGAAYQMSHAVFALACVALAAAASPSPAARRRVQAGWLASVGGLVFSLALSAIALHDLRVMGMVAPVGGVLMIAGWLWLAISAIDSQSDPV